MHKASWYEALKDQKAACHLCPHHCRIKPGQAGICRVRYNWKGVLYTRNYGRCSPPVLDPIEKKPLYHFYPGSLILSVGTFGCNFRCKFCQNWELAHGDPHLSRVEPEQLVAMAVRARDYGSVGIAYTYSEPTVWYEFIWETARLAHGKGLKNVLVTNGYIEEEPLESLLPYIDALNIDVKGLNGEFYRTTVRGDYRPVLQRAKQAYQAGKHVEITTLLIPGLNDREEEIEDLATWLAEELGEEVPLHFSRYVPNYQLELPPTPGATLLRAKEIAARRLQYVYLGNAPELESSSTFCPNCRELVIKRTSYRVVKVALENHCCQHCGSELNIVVNP